MTRTLTTLMTVCLGAFLLAGAGCEDKAAQAALKTCKNDLGNEQKLAASQTTTINDLKSQLAQAQAKAAEMSKEMEAAKAGKHGKATDEKDKAGETKQAKPAKAEEKEKAEKKEKKEAKK
jgi:hypothetical protein